MNQRRNSGYGRYDSSTSRGTSGRSSGSQNSNYGNGQYNDDNFDNRYDYGYDDDYGDYGYEDENYESDYRMNSGNYSNRSNSDFDYDDYDDYEDEEFGDTYSGFGSGNYQNRGRYDDENSGEFRGNSQRQYGSDMSGNNRGFGRGLSSERRSWENEGRSNLGTQRSYSGNQGRGEQYGSRSGMISGSHPQRNWEGQYNNDNRNSGQNRNRSERGSGSTSNSERRSSNRSRNY